jgi:hypothetical protein
LTVLWEAHEAIQESVRAARQAVDSADKARAAVNECLRRLNNLDEPRAFEP